MARVVACEIELRPDRVEWDITKAIALGAHGLFIVVPNARIREACRSRVIDFRRSVTQSSSLTVQVHTLRPAIRNVRIFLQGKSE